MYAKLLGILLFACQIILNSSSVINENRSADSTLTENRTATFPDGYTTFPEDHAAYKIYEDVLTWTEGRDRCIEDGARLAITDSYQKISHIDSLKTQETKNRFKRLHVGIKKSSSNDGQWVRIDNNLPVAPVPWVERGPDGIGNCAGISTRGGGLTDYPCEYEDEYFVCEIPL